MNYAVVWNPVATASIDAAWEFASPANRQRLLVALSAVETLLQDDLF